MPKTLIKIDLSETPYKNDMIHNRWHPDIPMVAWVKPGDDFVVEPIMVKALAVADNAAVPRSSLRRNGDCRSVGGLFGMRRLMILVNPRRRWSRAPASHAGIHCCNAAYVD